MNKLELILAEKTIGGPYLMLSKLLPALLLASTYMVSSAMAAPIYLGIFDGNDHLADVKAAILSATGVNADISLYDKSDEAPVLTNFTPSDPHGSLSGTWDVLDNSIFISYLTVKASNSFTLYKYDPAVNSGDWSTANILNKKGHQQELSHLSFWTEPRDSQAPEPSTIFFVGAGIVGLLTCRKVRIGTR